MSSIILSHFLVAVSGSRNSFLIWVLKLNHLFEKTGALKAIFGYLCTKKPLKQWNLRCSNWCNWLIIFMDLVWYVRANVVWYTCCLFSLLMHYHYWLSFTNWFTPYYQEHMYQSWQKVPNPPYFMKTLYFVYSSHLFTFCSTCQPPPHCSFCCLVLLIE